MEGVWESCRNAQGRAVSAYRMQVRLTDDGWNGSCEQPPITVQAGSFEPAKSEMEIALGKYVESRLREPQRPKPWLLKDLHITH